MLILILWIYFELNNETIAKKTPLKFNIFVVTKLSNLEYKTCSLNEKLLKCEKQNLDNIGFDYIIPTTIFYIEKISRFKIYIES